MIVRQFLLFYQKSMNDVVGVVLLRKHNSSKCQKLRMLFHQFYKVFFIIIKFQKHILLYIFAKTCL